MCTLFTFKTTCDYYSEVGQIRTDEYVKGKIREIEKCTYVKVGISIYFKLLSIKSEMYPQNTGTTKATHLL